MLTDCWSTITQLKGKLLHTLDQNHPFDVVDVDSQAITIHVRSTDHTRAIPRKDIEAAYQYLLDNGELTAREINQRFAHRSSAFVSALLATLPGVKYKLEPIRLLYRPSKGTTV